MLTKRLVERMGGDIGVESVAGVGSLFWVEFALTTAPRLPSIGPTVAEPERASAAIDAPWRTVLYVEDNSANLALVQQLIDRRADLSMLSAAEGQRGIELASTFRWDVILMDIDLPGPRGLAAMKILRADPATAHILIIAVRTNAIPRDIAACLEAGFDAYLTKPIRVSHFMDTLDRALQAAAASANTTSQATADSAASLAVAVADETRAVKPISPKQRADCRPRASFAIGAATSRRSIASGSRPAPASATRS